MRIGETEDRTYATAATSGNQRQEMLRTENITITSDPVVRKMTTIILSAVIYSKCMETIELGSFQRNMDSIYEENGLPRVKFPKVTNIKGMKEMYRDIIHKRTTQEEEVSEEVFEDVKEGAVEAEELTAKRHRETSTSPTEATEAKKKKDTLQKEGPNQALSLKLTPQEKPPVPPPAMLVSQKARERREATKTENRITVLYFICWINGCNEADYHKRLVYNSYSIRYQTLQEDVCKNFDASRQRRNDKGSLERPCKNSMESSNTQERTNSDCIKQRYNWVRKNKI